MLYSKLASFFMSLLMLPVIAFGGGGKKKEHRPPLRFPFGLVAAMPQSEATTVLTEKGMVAEGERKVGSEYWVIWKMQGQIVYENFKPDQAIATFDDQKLTSFAMIQGSLPNCRTTQPVYSAALEFATKSYDSKDAPITEEPPDSTLDCGPHGATADYHMRLENKKVVLIVVPAQGPAGYEVSATYYDRPMMKKKDESAEDPSKSKAPLATKKNL